MSKLTVKEMLKEILSNIEEAEFDNWVEDDAKPSTVKLEES